jgi:hypothetical protein
VGGVLSFPIPGLVIDSDWLMMLSTVAAFFDESGKFKDHDVISVGCVGGSVGVR